ncbi:DNA alkylation repair protein [Bacteroides gallinaceum]|uniref:DNA alkylation repair protein n=1 Tax=Bacteroides gallinaceum TaxID=1462571 RepID=UPI0015B1B4E5|nr:DNA alkylation repair protein [Bacteroides gallinaceum]MDM8155138.1 DNA alkylation repair protein [Bacteroides gallinaceum]
MEEYRLEGLTIKEHLLQLAERGNKKFTESLNPGVEHVLGIRVPDLRKLAARIAKDGWEAYLDTADTYYMEERMLQGMVLGCIRPDADIEVYLHRVTCFVWNINSWSVCDTFKFGGGKRFIEANKDRLWEYLKTWMRAEGEYEIRFGVVMAMQYFIDEEHIEELFSLYNAIRHEGYYVRMGVAWALSVCFVRFPERTLAYLKQNTLDNFTYNKALQKIIESYRVDAGTKDVIRAMKR